MPTLNWTATKLKEALELPPEGRREFLDRYLHEIPILRTTVLDLLANMEEDTGFLPSAGAIEGTLAELLARELAQEEGPSLPSLGDRVGNVRLERILGIGGMGAVFLGFDEKLERQVAVKTMRTDLRMRPEASSRFRREAKILSSLNHPGICQVYDLVEGADSEFLILELIEGKTLREISPHLAHDEKLRLAAEMSEALAVAHDQGIVHRDLKPDNVMVSESLAIKVLDFGIARLAGSVVAAGEDSREMAGGELFDSEHPGGLTGLGAVLGTVTFMSPEQARGDQVTSASDMYSFGLILHELFSGQPALDSDLPLPLLLAKISGGQVEPVAGIDSDLAALIEDLKRLEPTRRPTATAAYDQLQWIRDKPRRRLRRIVTISIATIFLLLIAKYGFDLRRERNAAITAREQALVAERSAVQASADSAQVVDFLVDLFAVSDPSQARGSTITARELLDAGAQKVRRDLEQQPLTQARLMATIGSVYWNLGFPEKARPLLDEALALRERELGQNHVDVAESLLALESLEFGLGRYEKAERLLLQALAIREASTDPDHGRLAEILNHLGSVYGYQGKYSDAEQQFHRAMTYLEQLEDPGHAGLAESLNGLGNLSYVAGRLDEAEQLYRRSLRISEKTLGPDHPKTAVSLHNLGEVCFDQGRLEEAEELYERSLAIEEKTLGPEHPDLVVTLCNLGELYQSQGRADEAELLFQRSLEISEKTLGPDHSELAMVLNNLGKLFGELGRFAEAEPLYLRALAIDEAALGSEHLYLAEDLHGLANLYRDSGRGQKALPFYRRALAIREAALEKDNPDLTSLYDDYARCLRANGQTREAE